VGQKALDSSSSDETLMVDSVRPGLKSCRTLNSGQFLSFASEFWGIQNDVLCVRFMATWGNFIRFTRESLL
jgi:hypothetical protein